MGVTGLELPPETSGKSCDSDSRGNKSGNIPGGDGSAGDPPSAPQTPDDPELAAVVEAWADLPDAVRAGILAMVRAAGGER